MHKRRPLTTRMRRQFDLVVDQEAAAAAAVENAIGLPGHKRKMARILKSVFEGRLQQEQQQQQQ